MLETYGRGAVVKTVFNGHVSYLDGSVYTIDYDVSDVNYTQYLITLSNKVGTGSCNLYAQIKDSFGNYYDYISTGYSANGTFIYTSLQNVTKIGRIRIITTGTSEYDVKVTVAAKS